MSYSGGGWGVKPNNGKNKRYRDFSGDYSWGPETIGGGGGGGGGKDRDDRDEDDASSYFGPSQKRAGSTSEEIKNGEGYSGLAWGPKPSSGNNGKNQNKSDAYFNGSTQSPRDNNRGSYQGFSGVAWGPKPNSGNDKNGMNQDGDDVGYYGPSSSRAPQGKSPRDNNGGSSQAYSGKGWGPGSNSTDKNGGDDSGYYGPSSSELNQDGDHTSDYIPQQSQERRGSKRSRDENGYKENTDHYGPSNGDGEARLTTSASSAAGCPTSEIRFIPSNHGQARRVQRGIGVRQLQSALKNGEWSRGGVPGRSKYTHNGVSVVMDDRTGHEVTSFATPTNLAYKDVSRQDWVNYESTKKKIKEQADYCTSHSVIVVDISGSMRYSDVSGATTRLGAVWLSIAEDFIRNRIESGVTTDKDALSVILMGENAQVHPQLDHVPTNWISYNVVLRIHKEGLVLPRGHGCYRPALAEAEKILMRYETHNCRLALMIMSDGRPSDGHCFNLSESDMSQTILSPVETLASKLGERLTISSIGMGSANQFQLLQDMTESAKSYGCDGAFELPSMSSSGIGAAMSSIATSFTATQMNGSRSRKIRAVTRENSKIIPLLTEVVDEKEFKIYMNDSVTHMSFVHQKNNQFEVAPLRHAEAKGVAIRKNPFGEGTERYAYQFFEIAGDGMTVVGEPLVAKESKFVADDGDDQECWEGNDRFVKRFCRIQYQAEKCAKAFNKKLDAAPVLDKNTARVSFVPCSIYYLNDPDRGEIAFIVEPRLFQKFEKWNSNNGWKKKGVQFTKQTKSGDKKSQQTPTPAVPAALPIIKEECPGIKKEEEEEETEKELAPPEKKKKSARVTFGEPPTSTPVVIDLVEDDDDQTIDTQVDKVYVSVNDVAQAFSHFSYVHSGHKALVCDLQGVFDRPKCKLVFTDPVIHYHNVRKEHKRNIYGRTDRGEKGIHDFLQTHECNCLCRLVCKGFLSGN